jgi:hypothetical protein
VDSSAYVAEGFPWRTISLWQPWATLVAIGAKHFETRSWAPKMAQGSLLAIHAAKRPVNMDDFSDDAMTAVLDTLEEHGHEFSALPHGAMLCVCRLGEVRRTEVLGYCHAPDYPECEFGDFSAGRYAWELNDVAQFAEPIPARGMQGLWWWWPEGMELDRSDVASPELQQAMGF